MVAGKNESNYSVWIGAKTRQLLQFLRPHLDERWDSVEI